MNEVLLALLIKKVEERLASLPDSSPLRGPRGQRGPRGEDGASFSIEEHGEQLRAWAKEFALKFSDLTPEQIAELRGPQGRDGRDGRDGKDFSLEENKTYLEELAQKFALKFEDLTTEQISQLRGPQGRDGRDGKDFDFESYREDIFSLISLAVDDAKEDLRLKFSDLTAEDIEKIRGPRGRDGRDGKNFDFEEHREFFESLKPKFSDFTPEERESLRLKFSDLSQDERDSLKLRFSDLTDEDRLSLRGARGPRGQRGSQGEKGEKGEKGDTVVGPRGVPGQPGPRGRAGIDGRDGRDGRDGKDAPYITDIKLEEFRGEIKFIFEFSDSTYLETDSVKLPHQTWTVVGGSAAGGGGGGGEKGDPGDSAYQVAVNNGFVGTEEEWLESLVGPAGPDGADGADGTDGLSAYEIAVADGFIGTEEEWLESLKGEKGDKGDKGDSGAGISFSANIAPDATVAVDTVPLEDFSAVEFSVALKKGNLRSFMKLVAQKSDEGDFMSEWEHLYDVPEIGGLGVIVEKMWESAVAFDIGLEATVVGSDMKLFFKNNESIAVQVSGTRQPVPDFV